MKTRRFLIVLVACFAAAPVALASPLDLPKEKPIDKVPNNIPKSVPIPKVQTTIPKSQPIPKVQSTLPKSTAIPKVSSNMPKAVPLPKGPQALPKSQPIGGGNPKISNDDIKWASELEAKVKDGYSPTSSESSRYRDLQQRATAP